MVKFDAESEIFMPSSPQGWKRNPLEEERLGISRSFAPASALSSATRIHCVSLCHLQLKVLRGHDRSFGALRAIASGFGITLVAIPFQAKRCGTIGEHL